MKKNFILLMASLILFAASVSSLTPTYTNAATSSYYINITIISQTPDPVEPGQYVELRFKVENWGSDTAENLAVEILPEYPFSLEPGEDAVKSIGSLQGRQVGKTGVIVKYRLKVDENAVEGENEIELKYRTEQQGYISYGKPEPFIVDIQTHDAIISVESIKSEPKEFAPGESGLLTITIKNLADSLLKEIKAKLEVTQTTTTTTTVTTTDYPFSPIGSANEKTIEKLGAGKTVNVTFNLIAEPDAEAGVYKVPLRLDYSDELGKNYTKNLIVGLIIGEEPDLAVNLEKSTVISGGMKGKVTLKFVNKGTNDIKFCYVMLQESADYKLLSPENVYVGNIDSDDYETVDFDLYVNSKKKVVNLPVIVEYKDANNKDYQETLQIPLRLYSFSEAKRYGLKKGSSGIGIITIIVIVGAGLFFYRRWKKKKKAKK